MTTQEIDTLLAKEIDKFLNALEAGGANTAKTQLDVLKRLKDHIDTTLERYI